jgi:hypothetical protein
MNFEDVEKASIGIFNNLIYLPPYVLERYLAPTAKAIKLVNDLANTLFSEKDATVIKSLFAEASLTGASTQRDVTEQPLKDTVAATIDLKNIMKSK